ncbi:alpha/beta hydrolase [Pseudarthrobacter sp. J75]|uniref:alpha/beta hydrolase n=1 Tax=Pseudarthrobacter sp. J75 TaxID=3116486 RepID=UPI002E803976|nr:alpha/beta hydrolase [Pseudarthrobacter sp. J75]MEE2527557.1 alpha/beta hydrolase [Pseudarthrobacter sp. J75]
MCGPQAAAQPGKQVLGLALICPVVVAEHAERDVPERTVLYRDPAVTGALDAEDARDYAEMAVTESQENWELFRDHALPGLRAFDRRAIGRIAGRYSLDRQPETGEFHGPTLIITGRQDHVVGYRDAFRLLEHYPRATMSVLDGAGHNAHLDQPDLVHTLLDEWLSRVAASQMSEVSR